MLVIPISKKLSWRNPPLVTLLMIFLNAFIFFAFQNNEKEKLTDASKYYFQSGLAEMEVMRYLAHVNQNQDNQQPVSAFSSKDDEKLIKYYLKMRSDGQFMHLLLSDQIIRETDQDYSSWKSMRLSYHKKMDDVVSWRYGLRPVAPRPLTWFSYMFLHGGLGHLIGNMIFLWLIGCMIEYGSGRLLFMTLYLLGGLAAAGLFWAINPHSQIPLVGASGAISGIMGAFCVFYGLKKVRIFLTLGFYFNYLKFPALLMLPIWVGYELFQMLTMKGSNVAYAAHIGGLLGGAGLTYFLTKMPRVVDQEAFEEEQEEGDEAAMEQALHQMRNLEYDKARELFHQILSKQPDNIEAMQHLYAMEKQTPEAAAFHKISGRLLQQLTKNESTYKDARDVYHDYLQYAAPPRLAVALYLRLSSALASLGEVTDAKKLLSFLLKKAPHEPGLPLALLKLARAFQKKGMADQQKQCLQLLTHRFPESAEARLAKQAL